VRHNHYVEAQAPPLPVQPCSNLQNARIER
jgi:hypothetical protein